jgi:hypothetical protein
LTDETDGAKATAAPRAVSNDGVLPSAGVTPSTVCTTRATATVSG